jgi:hypothetical protein
MESRLIHAAALTLGLALLAAYAVAFSLARHIALDDYSPLPLIAHASPPRPHP